VDSLCISIYQSSVGTRVLNQSVVVSVYLKETSSFMFMEPVICFHVDVPSSEITLL
jgi:hypothetical protein